MPRVNANRSLANERNLARRIRFERESRAMSFEGLANRMTHLGMPMQKTTIFKIEQGDPPRRITVDEMVGFATVFDLSVQDLLVPVELLHERRLMEVWQEASALTRQIEQIVVTLASTMREAFSLVETYEGTAAQRRLVRNALDNVGAWAAKNADKTFGEVVEAERASRPWPDGVDKALRALNRAVEKWAKEQQDA